MCINRENYIKSIIIFNCSIQFLFIDPNNFKLLMKLNSSNLIYSITRKTNVLCFYVGVNLKLLLFSDRNSFVLNLSKYVEKSIVSIVFVIKVSSSLFKKCH